LFLVPGAVAAQEAVHDWTGPYLGFALGAAKGNTHFDISGNLPSSSTDIPVLGASGTVTLGVNAQSGSFVYGIAGDGSLLTARGSGTASGGTIDTALDQLFALRGRLGLTTGNMLFFATAGIAVGHESFDSKIVYSTPVHPPRDALGNGYVYGPTYGVGVEVALSDKVSLTAEGLVTNLSSLTASGDTGKSGGSYTATATHSDVTLRGGLNFHF
jgi:hypothetical protein